MNNTTTSRSNRMHHGSRKIPNPQDPRSSARHDRDRVLYSPEFRRLANVTQVLSPENQRVVHNRLTHTLEVAQIGRTIAEKIICVDKPDPELVEFAGGLDSDVVETAALVHDIGHPPFGHITEDTLNTILHSHPGPTNGFEGNAQSFRIVASLAGHTENYPGLNLTAASLSAILKYPWTENTLGKPQSKWGVYDDEIDTFEFARSHLDSTWRDKRSASGQYYRTLEAEIMDWADDVAYAIHDMEDFYKEHLIPVDRLASDEAERQRFIEFHVARQKNQRAMEIDRERASRLFYDSPMVTKRFDQSRRAKLDLRTFSSSMIGRFVTSPRLVVSETHPRGWDLEISEEVRSEIRILKSLLSFYVLDQPSLLSVRHGYVRLIEELFDILLELAYEESGKQQVLPIPVQEALKTDIIPERAIADFIAGMTDIQVISYYRRLTGISFGDSFDLIV